VSYPIIDNIKRGASCNNPTYTAYTISNVVYNYEGCKGLMEPGSVNIGDAGPAEGCAARCTGDCVGFNWYNNENCRTMTAVNSIHSEALYGGWNAYSLAGRTTLGPVAAATTTPAFITTTTQAITTTTPVLTTAPGRGPRGVGCSNPTSVTVTNTGVATV
jgi:hypothetical protein